MVCEYLINKYAGIKQDFSFVAKDSEVNKWNVVPTVALLSAYIVGIVTSGVIPGTAALQVGICPVQAAIVGIIVYCCLRFYRNPVKQQQYQLAFAKDSLIEQDE